MSKAVIESLKLELMRKIAIDHLPKCYEVRTGRSELRRKWGLLITHRKKWITRAVAFSRYPRVSGIVIQACKLVRKAILSHG